MAQRCERPLCYQHIFNKLCKPKWKSSHALLFKHILFFYDLFRIFWYPAAAWEINVGITSFEMFSTMAAQGSTLNKKVAYYIIWILEIHTVSAACICLPRFEYLFCWGTTLSVFLCACASWRCMYVPAHVFMWLTVACFLEIRLQCLALCSLHPRQTVIRGISYSLQGTPLQSQPAAWHPSCSHWATKDLWLGILSWCKIRFWAVRKVLRPLFCH